MEKNEFNTELHKYLCQFCRKNYVTKQCDFPDGRWRLCGHPLSKIHADMANIPMSGLSTCDNYMCNECATNITKGIDFCPTCMKKIQLICNRM